MKQANWWILPSVLAMLGIAAITFVAFSDDSVGVPGVSPAPSRAPDVHFVVSGSKDVRHPAFRVNSDWQIDGRTESEPIIYPIEWPSAIDLSGSQSVTVRVLAESIPATVEMRQYEQLGPDGSAMGEPLATMSWLHPDLFQRNHNSGNPVAWPRNSNEQTQGWEFDLGIAPSNTISFITIWITWKGSREENQIGPYSANWNFSVVP